MKKFRKLIPALALLLVSAVLMSTASYAWFSMNNKVTVTGMEVKTKTSSNLFVQNIAANASALPDESGYKSSTVDAKTALLEPVSTTTAADDSFFYHSTETVSAEGKPTESGAVYIDYDSTGVGAAVKSDVFADKFSENYNVTKSDATAYTGTKASAFIDNVVILKAVNVGEASHIYLNYANLIYNGTKSLGAKSYRLAVFTEKWNPAGETFGSKTLLTILAPSGAQNFNNGKAVSSESGLGDVTYNTEAVINVAANTTEYYRVTARLYLEGEDKTCNNETYMLLTSNWSLEMAFSLATSGTGATSLAQYESKLVSSTLTYWDGTKKYTAIDGSDEGTATSAEAWAALS